MLENTERYVAEEGAQVAVQVPQERLEALLAAITAADPLEWGDYDAVSFASQPGVQRFRSLGTGRNPETGGVVTVACIELRFFVARTALERVVRAIYGTHPYEEPVVIVTPASRSRHRRGVDEDNPNRFWNSPDETWVPEAHRAEPSGT